MEGSIERYLEEMIRLNPTNIRVIDYPSKNLQSLAVKLSPYVAVYISPIHYEVVYEMLKKDGNNIQYLPQTHEYCMEALRNTGNAIKHIINPQLDMQITAIKNDPSAIIYIEKPHPDLQNYL